MRLFERTDDVQLLLTGDNAVNRAQGDPTRPDPARPDPTPYRTRNVQYALIKKRNMNFVLAKVHIAQSMPKLPIWLRKQREGTQYELIKYATCTFALPICDPGRAGEGRGAALCVCDQVGAAMWGLARLAARPRPRAPPRTKNSEQAKHPEKQC